ncbi:MAG: MFS transporter, partial [bacterium]|nr:MFS transporter [bacterium]
MSKTIKALFLGLFFVSGACGLIYEIAWSRLLVFVFGGTTFAVTTVLGCFMGGLGLGSFIAAKLDKKIKRPERTYGILEICIGLYCIFIPFLFKLTLPVYQSMVNTFGESFLVLTVVRIIICVAILIVPTTCMGATLPVLCKALTRRSGHRGRSIALLYGINTLGAFIGCVLAGFMLLPMAGLTMSIWIAALLNVAAGVIALVMSKKTAPVEDGLKLPEEQSKKESTKQSKKQLQLTKGVRHPRLVLWLFALSGFAAMAYQVAWIRSLILSMGASTYSFTAIVACFILGLAVGSLVISSFIDRLKHPLMVAGILELVIAVSALVVVPAFGDMHRFVASFVSVEGITFSGILIKELIYVFGLLIVPTVCMGALMPLVMKIYNPGQTARSVGHVYAANTWGTITGSFCAGFLLIPHELIGMQSTIIIASAASGIIGILFISMDTKKQKLPAWITTGVLTASCLFLMASTPQWSKAAMISGPYLGIKKELHDESEILFYKEGIDTTVAVTGDKTHRSLLVNGKADASNHYSDMVTQSLLGYIPMFLAPNAKEVCVIGLGAGVTVKSVLDFDIDSVDVVEISEAVKEASVLFEPLIGKPLADKRTTYHRNDGRNYLAVTDKTFDVIISEPSNPWISGIANLFSQEFFRLAKESLKPGGLHCQWVQSYSMEYDNFGAIINTMASVFEYVNCWEASTGDYLVIGSDKPIALDVENLYFQFAGKSIRNMLAQMKISDPMQIANHYVADRTQLKPLMEGKKILADDIP